MIALSFTALPACSLHDPRLRGTDGGAEGGALPSDAGAESGAPLPGDGGPGKDGSLSDRDARADGAAIEEDSGDACIPDGYGECTVNGAQVGSACGNCGALVCSDGGLVCEDVPFSTVSALGAGGIYSCALLSGGNVRCWGDNTDGSLGDGTFTSRNVASTVDAVSGVRSISTGYDHACALANDDTIWCWGSNEAGQLGDGTSESRPSAVQVQGLAGTPRVVVAGGGGFTCAILDEAGTVQCWGDNRAGQLGDGTLDDSAIPVDVVGVESAVKLALGRSNACAVVGEGEVMCWGGNLRGQLGVGDTEVRETAVTVQGLSGPAVDVGVGADHACALLETGGVECWGYNEYGQLGNDSMDNSSVPVPVVGLSSGVVQLSVGGFHSCARLETGGARCWGFNVYGGLGNDDIANSDVPVDVLDGLAVLQISAGSGKSHTCALMAGLTPKCFGPNDRGQLGDGSYLDRHVPVRVQGLAGLCPP